MKDQRLEDIPLIPAEEITDEQLEIERLFMAEEIDVLEDIWEFEFERVTQTIHI